MENSHILIIEDEKEISDLIANHLRASSLLATSIFDGKDAVLYLQSENKKNIDLILLDRMLPSMNGIEICKFIRVYNDTKNIPILMLTALGTPEQIIEGLDAGADDYMTKPFDLNILTARVRSLLRRGELFKNLNPKKDNILTYKDLTIDLDQCKTFIHKSPIDLTLSEYKMLVCFLQSPGKVLTRNQLVEYIQDGPVHVTDRTIDTHIFGLRKKLGDYSSIVETIRGIGYRVAIHD